MDKKTENSQPPSKAPTDKPVKVIVKPTEKKPTAKPVAAKLMWLVLIVALLALAVSLYQWQQRLTLQQSLQQNEVTVAAAVQRLDEQAAANNNLQRQLDQQLVGSKQQQQLQQQRIDKLQGQVDSQQRRLLSISTTSRDDWLLAEAEYLIRLANQRLLMAKEVAGSLELLQAADTIAKELDDSALYFLRQSLAEDMAALRAISGFDLEGVYLQLGALAKQADSLRLIALPELTANIETQAIPEDWQQRLEYGLQDAWSKLGQYIQIKRRDEIYQPLLAPEYEAAVRQNIQLMFEQAQMAALAGKQRLYQDSLAKAKAALKNYYNLDTKATNEIIIAIEKLSTQPVAVSLPDISGSLQTIKNYLASLHMEKPAAAKPQDKAAETGSAQ
ncbi:MAG: uroporphyrin-3 C-methyltransferase [Oceanicoccus sp.]